MDPRAPNDPLEFNRTTLKSGAPIGDKLNSLLLGQKGPNLLADVAYLEETAHFNRERIPERVVHAKGAAALGEFVVTSKDIKDHCKASLFGSLGRTTSVVARFSHVTGESGISDTPRDVHGFAVKFYTDQGNWDLVGNNLPVFFIRDPINFSSFIHSQKRNPKTHLRDPDAFWDFIGMLPESLHTISMLFSDRGTPDGFRHMHGYGVNTFKIINSMGEAFYAKFHWICNQGIRNLDEEGSKQIAGIDPDYSIRDLQLSISKGQFPSWTLKYQVMSLVQASRATFNIFDVTKTWPMGEYPLQEIGRMTLSQNPDNYFAQVEQLAFSPANMVPGIEASPDKMLIGRMFSYPDAQRYRLGVNYTDMPVNQARCPVMTPTYCDGSGTFMSNLDGRVPNYVPSIKFPNMMIRDEKFVEDGQVFGGKVGRFDLSKDDNYSQPRILIKNVLDAEARQRLAANIAAHLSYVTAADIVKKILGHFTEIDEDFSEAIGHEMKKKKKNMLKPKV